METRLRLYFQQIGQQRHLRHSGPNLFTITMIAVNPDERGRGHLRAMLARLIKYLENNSLVEYVLVSTYDYAKVEMYEHLGFTTVEEAGADDMKSWVLKLPLAM